MIYEFFPLESAWQLLPRPLSLEQFERLPFVRSLFFRKCVNVLCNVTKTWG